MSPAASRERVAIDAAFEDADALRATRQAPPRKRPHAAPPARARAIPRWPVRLCAFIAIAAATGAFLESPIAAHPAIAPFADALVSSVVGVFDRAIATLP
jgi:hypothetical protein